MIDGMNEVSPQRNTNQTAERKQINTTSVDDTDEFNFKKDNIYAFKTNQNQIN